MHSTAHDVTKADIAEHDPWEQRLTGLGATYVLTDQEIARKGQDLSQEMTRSVGQVAGQLPANSPTCCAAFVARQCSSTTAPPNGSRLQRAAGFAFRCVRVLMRAGRDGLREATAFQLCVQVN